jgi:parafibromin
VQQAYRNVLLNIPGSHHIVIPKNHSYDVDFFLLVFSTNILVPQNLPCSQAFNKNIETEDERHSLMNKGDPKVHKRLGTAGIETRNSMSDPSLRKSAAVSAPKGPNSPRAISPQDHLNRTQTARQSDSQPTSALEETHLISASSLPANHMQYSTEVLKPKNTTDSPPNALNLAQLATSNPASTDHPRPAQEGYEWVWFPQGYWAERFIIETKPSSKRTGRFWWGRDSKRRTLALQEQGTELLIKQIPRRSSEGRPHVLWTQSSPASRKPSGSWKKDNGNSNKEAFSPWARGLHFLSPTYPHFISPDGEPEGLYCKAKRGWESGLSPKRKKVYQIVEMSQVHLLTLLKIHGRRELMPPTNAPSITTFTLEGVSSYFNHVESHIPPARVASDKSTMSYVPRLEIGKAPWHRSGSQDGDGWSVTSSIRGLLMGKTPVPSPGPYISGNRKSKKTSVKRQSYFLKQIFECIIDAHSDIDTLFADNGTFLPTVCLSFVYAEDESVKTSLGLIIKINNGQEARRVHTPPLSGPKTTGFTRGFFFDMNPDIDNERHEKITGTTSSIETSDLRTSSSETFKPEYLSSPSSHERREWWDVDIPTSLKREESNTASFVFEIPEHFPSSPLCPLHPKNISRGNGVCRYHGRVKWKG